MQRERLERRPLIALKAHARNLLRSAMHPSVGGLCRPRQRPCVKVGVVEKLTAIEKALAHVADRALDLALGAGAIRATGADPKSPVRRESRKLQVLEELAAARALVIDDHCLQLIEEQLGGYTAESAEGSFEATHQH